MEKGKVSIIVPCYKQAEYLSEALDSVCDQDYANWECIIVNDGSPDNTEDIAKQYIKKDSRFIYISKNNGGLASARNNGIENSKGEYILPLDADDRIEPTYLKKAVEMFVQHPELKLVYCKADKFGMVNEPWDLEEFSYNRFIWNNCIFCSALYKRVDYNKTCGYNPNMRYGYEDWDFWLSLIHEGDIVFRLDEVLFHYRVKQVSMTTGLLGNVNETMLIQLCKNHPSIYSNYQERVIIYQQRIQIQQKAINSIQSSHAYRIGKAILRPFLWIKRHL